MLKDASFLFKQRFSLKQFFPLSSSRRKSNYLNRFVRCRSNSSIDLNKQKICFVIDFLAAEFFLFFVDRKETFSAASRFDSSVNQERPFDLKWPELVIFKNNFKNVKMISKRLNWHLAPINASQSFLKFYLTCCAVQISKSDNRLVMCRESIVLSNKRTQVHQAIGDQANWLEDLVMLGGKWLINHSTARLLMRFMELDFDPSSSIVKELGIAHGPGQGLLWVSWWSKEVWLSWS